MPSGTPAITLFEKLFQGGKRMHDIRLPLEGEMDTTLWERSPGVRVHKAMEAGKKMMEPDTKAKQRAFDEANRQALDPSLQGIYNAAKTKR